MMNYLKNQGTWKLSQLKNLSFEEVKEEFDKLVKQVESFAPINFEATKASLKRFGEELQTKTTKRLKDDEAKDAEPAKKSGKRRKQMARKGLHTDLDKDDSEGSDEVSEQDDSVSGTKIPINPVPVAMKSPSIATYKIIKQEKKECNTIVREEWKLIQCAKGLQPEQYANNKGISNPFMVVMFAKNHMIFPQTTAISNIKLPILKKEEYDIWAMEMEHYLEYIDNEVWKISWTGYAKRSGEAQTGLVEYGKFKENARSCCQTTLMVAGMYQLRMANQKVIRSLPPAWSNLAMTMRTNPEIDTLSIDDLYNNLRVFEQEIQGASKTSSSAQNVAFVSQSKSSTNKVKSGFTGAYSIFLDFWLRG
ncbi:hypothetical protein Tco_0396541 [Tanacetum coccineum]